MEHTSESRPLPSSDDDECDSQHVGQVQAGSDRERMASKTTPEPRPRSLVNIIITLTSLSALSGCEVLGRPDMSARFYQLKDALAQMKNPENGRS
jgi:hypothetical protein